MLDIDILPLPVLLSPQKEHAEFRPKLQAFGGRYHLRRLTQRGTMAKEGGKADSQIAGVRGRLAPVYLDSR